MSLEIRPTPATRLEVLECFLRRLMLPPLDLYQEYGPQPPHEAACTGYILELVAPLPTPSTPLAPPPLAGAENQHILELSRLQGVDPFIHHSLGRLLLQLSHSTVQKQETLHGQVRGRIQWNATYKARYSQEYNPTLYVCAQVQHLYDTPENQLVKYLLEHSEQAIKAIPDALRAGMCYLPAKGLAVYEDIAKRLEMLETALHRLKRSARLRGISAPLEISERHLLRAETSRVEEYAVAAELYRRYRSLVLQASWESLAKVARHALPLPGVLTPATRPWVHLAADVYKLAGN
jgi:hypothetical protein